MLRRIITTLFFVVAGLLAVPMLVSAATNPPYPAPRVTPGTVAWTLITDPAIAFSQDAGLASTGAGFSVGTALLSGAAVLVVGVTLMIIGNRFRTSGRH